MKRSFRLAAICAAFVLSVAMCASAGSTDNFSGTLVGASGSESGSFTFNSATGFSNISLSFAGSTFGNVNASNGGGKATCSNGLCGYYWQTTVGSDTIWDAIVVNLATGQFEDFGGIYNSQNQGGWNYISSPEGGSVLAYLFLSAFAVFGAIFVSGKYRRATPTA